MQKGITTVGLDAHEKFIKVAMLLPGKRSVAELKVANGPSAIRRTVKKLVREAPGLSLPTLGREVPRRVVHSHHAVPALADEEGRPNAPIPP